MLRNVFGELHTIATNSGRHIYKVKKIKIDVICCMNTTSLLSLQLQNKKSIIYMRFLGYFQILLQTWLLHRCIVRRQVAESTYHLGVFQNLNLFFYLVIA